MQVEQEVWGCMQVEQEAAATLLTDPPAGVWPTVGSIAVKNAVMRYRPSLPTVLKHVSFQVCTYFLPSCLNGCNVRHPVTSNFYRVCNLPQHVHLGVEGKTSGVQVEAGAHTGIVGRTGSGKSSLFLAFFRMVELESGSIIIDGTDIASLGLTVVRKGLSMIPQNPFMFSGTVRGNLDPFAQYSDTEVWQALERVSLKNVILSMDTKLESLVTDNGGNFSQGQRQLFCLARALLRQSRVRPPSVA
jgi:ABC-type multidrug transport system fused ATPase/permease subunit